MEPQSALLFKEIPPASLWEGSCGQKAVANNRAGLVYCMHCNGRVAEEKTNGQNRGEERKAAVQYEGGNALKSSLLLMDFSWLHKARPVDKEAYIAVP